MPYYDKEGKVVRTFSQHYLGGTSMLSQYNYDDVQTGYNFARQPITVLPEAGARVPRVPIMQGMRY